MRLGVRFGALVAGALILAGCGNTGDPSATPAPGTDSTAAPAPPSIVSPSLLDVGRYPTVPRPPLGTAGNPAAGAIADAKHMADFVVGPWEVDPSLITPYLDSFYVIDSPKTLLQLGPETVAVAAGLHGLVDGFASAREAPDKVKMVNAVLRFANPDQAAAASAAMADAAAKQPIKGITPTNASIPGHPDTVAVTYPFTAEGSDRSWATVRSFTPHGPYVLTQFVQSLDGFDAAAGLVAKAVDEQGPAIDQFKAADPADLAAVPLDPTGLLARTQPATTALTVAKNAVYGVRGAMHLQGNPIASAKLFEDTGITEVAMAKTNVYQAEDGLAAVRVIKAFSDEISAAGGKPVDPVPGLPESQCLTLAKGFYCVAPAGRYAIEAQGEPLPDVHQQVAAQYVMLTTS